MNEQHEDDVDRFGAKITVFKKQNPHLLLGTDFPRGSMAYAEKYGYSHAWNYAERRTREHLLAIVSEMLTGYDVDGLELDFCRSPPYFKLGGESQGLPRLTEFVREVRAEVDRLGRQRDRKIVLAVRVPPGFERCRALGLDAEGWVRQGLVDLVTPMDPGYLDMQPKLAEFVESARSPRVVIAGGVEPNTWGNGKRIAQLFAAASGLREQGAQCLYLFNFDCHRTEGRANAYTADEVRFLKTVASPGQVACEDKHYFVTRDMRNRLPEEGGVMQLPAKIPPGQCREFSLFVGDDLAAARTEGKLDGSRLSITMDPFGVGRDGIDVTLNGTPLGYNGWRREGKRCSCDDPPVRKGRNVLQLHLSPQAQPAQPAHVEKIELILDYKRGTLGSLGKKTGEFAAGSKCSHLEIGGGFEGSVGSLQNGYEAAMASSSVAKILKTVPSRLSL
jgi:hypothetical protein